jgi:hypothetical protein
MSDEQAFALLRGAEAMPVMKAVDSLILMGIADEANITMGLELPAPVRDGAAGGMAALVRLRGRISEAVRSKEVEGEE